MTMVPVRLPDEMIAAIDAKAGDGQRAKWIRSAIEAALGGVPAAVDRKRAVAPAKPKMPSPSRSAVVPRRVKPEVPVRVDGEPQFTREDNAVVWRQLYGRRGSERMLADALGWMPGRVSKAVSSLLAAGQVRGIGEGFLEVVE